MSFLLFILGFITPSFAEVVPAPYKVTKILSSRKLQIKPTLHHGITSLHVGDLLILKSQDDQQIIGYAHILEIDSKKETLTANVRTHANNEMIRIEDRAFPVDLSDSSIASQTMNTARLDLVVTGNKRISNKYKPQVYLGALAGQTAASLERDEWFIGPGLLAYGLNERLQFGTLPFLNFLGEPNAQVKYGLYQNEDFRISASMEGRYNFDSRKMLGSWSVYWDTFSNSKFLTYNQIRVTTVGSTLNDNQVSTEFSMNYGYITDRWNRIIFGPNFNFNDRTLGGLVSYQWVWDIFTASFTVQTTDFTRLQFDHDGYLFYLDFWWRL